jgi:hypothetical protein
MNKQFPAGWVIAILTLIAYFSIGILTGEAPTYISVLLNNSWYLVTVCRIRYNGLKYLEENRLML